MNPFEYLALWAFVLAWGGMGDYVWVEHVRPKLARRFGWRQLTKAERIPPWAWLGAMAAVAVLGFVSYAGALVGLS